jgi:hypothetical protein
MAERINLVDSNYVALGTTANPLIVNSNKRVVSKLVTMDGGTLNGIGDINGTQNPYTIFTVTGVVKATVFGVCGLTIVGAGTIEVGVTGDTAVLLAQIANATDLATGELYVDATPTTKVQAPVADQIITGGLDILFTAGTADLTAGNITFYCIWEPLSSGATVVAA